MKKNSREFLTELVTEAGRILLRYFGKVGGIRQKENASSVVCEADLASEDFIVRRIRQHFPDAGLIAEESGYSAGSERTFVIDPLDGTSNFIAGLPWFGVQVALLEGGVPTSAAMYLPIEKVLYFSEKGRGVMRNGRRVVVTPEKRLKNVLCAFGMDGSANEQARKQSADLVTRVASGVRNLRTTNSLVDFCYTLEGKFGACVNLKCKIWDIVPVALMLPEAGGLFGDLWGTPIEFELGQKDFGRSYQIMGASKALHPKLARLINANKRELVS
jgi:myo-inositol-1(or 4)-monophosphatase